MVCHSRFICSEITLLKLYMFSCLHSKSGIAGKNLVLVPQNKCNLGTQSPTRHYNSPNEALEVVVLRGGKRRQRVILWGRVRYSVSKGATQVDIVCSLVMARTLKYNGSTLSEKAGTSRI